MNRIYFLLFLTTVLTEAQSQRIKYKDLFPLLAGMSLDEQKNSLKEYISQDIDHPNANYRLALVYEANFKRADPLTQYEYAVANAEAAKRRFLKAKQVVDEKEVIKNNEYYSAGSKTIDAKGKPVIDFASVSKRMTSAMDSTNLFLEKIPSIYWSFTQSVDYYDHAVKIFASLNKEYLTLDDLLLYYNNAVDKQLLDLKANFDSSRFFFDRYQELIKAFPIPFHKQQYHINPVVTYRLDGLIARMNFLTDDVEFWDYGTWVNAIRKEMTTEIHDLRQKVNHNEEKLDETLAKIESSNGEAILPFKLDKQLVYNLNNYEKQSLALALLEYKASKQDWMIKTKTLHADTSRIDRTAENFSILIYANKSADTLLDIVKTRIEKDKIRKHAEFINKYYGGTDGLLKFSTDQRSLVQSSFIQYAAELRAALVAMRTPDTVRVKEKLIRFNNRWNISVLVRQPTTALIEKGDPITLQNVKSPDGSIYLAGVYKPDKKINNLVTFVARINPDGKPGWLQSFNLRIDSASSTSDANNLLGPLQLTQEGCALIVHSVHLTRAEHLNTFIYLNEKGEDKFKIKLKEPDYPRKLVFVERSNSFVILLRGKDEKQQYSSSESISILGINAVGDLLWKREHPLTGTVVDLINLIDGFLVIGNYKTLPEPDGREYRSENGGSSPFLIKLNERGEIVKIKPVITAKTVFLVDVVKLSDNSINLLGFENDFETGPGKTVQSEGRIIHIMANRLGQLICSNL